MAVLDILRYPDHRLHTVAKPVAAVDDRVRRLVADMAETMYHAPGIGLAATQVDVHLRVIVIDVSDTRDQLQVFINPEITRRSEESKVYEEGCLSIPDVTVEIERPATVTVSYIDREGKQQELAADGLLATALQHEIDHLDGHLIIDFLSRLKRDMVIRKFKKLKRD